MVRDSLETVLNLEVTLTSVAVALPQEFKGDATDDFRGI